MGDPVFRPAGLTEREQALVSAGLEAHSSAQQAPRYVKEQISWRIRSDDGELVGALSASMLWDWLYLDELWVSSEARGGGVGRSLVEAAERHAREQSLVGLWLWTQSWQAGQFYERLSFEAFARLPDFPRGHTRLGYRRIL